LNLLRNYIQYLMHERHRETTESGRNDRIWTCKELTLRPKRSPLPGYGLHSDKVLNLLVDVRRNVAKFHRRKFRRWKVVIFLIGSYIN